MVTIVPPGQLAPPEKLETQVVLPLPSNIFQVRLPHSAGGWGGSRGRGLSALFPPSATGLSPGWLLVLVPCAMEERGRRPLSRPMPFAPFAP